MAQSALSAGTFIKTHPATGETLGEYPFSTEADVIRSVQAAQGVFAYWRQVPVKQRSLVLKRVAQKILDEADSLAALISEEVGKPIAQAMDGDMLSAVSLLQYYARKGPGWLKPSPLPWDKSILMGRTHAIHHLPKGVVGVITPWNYPLAIAVSGIATALLAGNTVVYKPSEETPKTAQWVTDAFHQALSPITGEGRARQIVSQVYGDGQTGHLLLEQHLAHVFFTGSSSVGLAIKEALVRQPVGLTLEMGGADALVMLKGADLDVVSSYGLWGRLINAGQACAAVKRILVPMPSKNALEALLVDKMSRIRMGDPQNGLTQLGPLISQAHREKLHQLVLDALDKGARCLIGGAIPEGPGAYYPATLLADVPEDARILREEAFGPVLTLMTYHTPEEAAHRVNQSPYGLGASLFGNPALARELAPQLEVGMVAFNDLPTLGYALPQVPWQGRKESGLGQSHGKHGLLALTHSQVVTQNWMARIPGFAKPFWHFGEGSTNGLERQMLGAFHSSNLLSKLNPAFLAALWRNRSSRKW